VVATCRQRGSDVLGFLAACLRARLDGTPAPSLRSLDPGNVVYLGTVSKVFAPGVRVGWALADHGLVQRLVLAKEAADLCGSSFNQLVAERYLAGSRWRPNLGSLVETYRARRDAMLAALEEHAPEGCEWTRPAGGFYVWVTVPGYIDTSAMLAAAVERRVAYVPGTAFYADGRGRDRMRLAFCHPTEDDIVEGVRRLAALLRDEADLYRSLAP
jgi:DNA-binding transcriptional MocR family regulator